MNVVDSSGWMEYFAGGSNAGFFAEPIEDLENLLVPSICVYEVFKRILQLFGRADAEIKAAELHKGKLVDLTVPLAMHAAVLSHEHKLAMVDSIILATAKANKALLWTQDEHFKGLPDVRFIEKTGI